MDSHSFPEVVTVLCNLDQWNFGMDLSIFAKDLVAWPGVVSCSSNVDCSRFGKEFAKHWDWRHCCNFFQPKYVVLFLNYSQRALLSKQSPTSLPHAFCVENEVEYKVDRSQNYVTNHCGSKFSSYGLFLLQESIIVHKEKIHWCFHW